MYTYPFHKFIIYHKSVHLKLEVHVSVGCGGGVNVRKINHYSYNPCTMLSVGITLGYMSV